MVSTEKILHLRTIKKEYITAEKLNRFRAKIPDGERRIGSLPYDWIKRITGTAGNIRNLIMIFSLNT